MVQAEKEAGRGVKKSTVKDKDGTIKKLEKLRDPDQLAAVMLETDLDHNGKISLSEYTKMI